MAFVPILVAVGTAISAVGKVASAMSQAKASNYNAEIGKQNSQIALGQGEAAAQANDRDARRRIGAAMAAYGASGVALDDGSPMDVLADSASNAALDNATIRYNYRLRSNSYLNQAKLDEMQAKSAKTSAYFGAATSIYQGATDYYQLSHS